MATPLGADDWIVPQEASAPARAPSTGGDDWFVPEEKPTFTQKLESADKSITPAPMARVEKAVAEGEVQGFGNEPVGLSPEHEAALGRAGIFHNPETGYAPGLQGAAQFANEAIIRPAAAGADAFFRAIGAGVQGIASGAGQVAREFGQNETQAGKLSGDVGTMEDLALMAPIPEMGLLHAETPAPKLSTPEEIAAFNRAARSAPGAPPPPPSQTRADIDEFLRQRAAREARSQAAQQLLSPPSEDRAAPATAAPQAGAPPPEAPVAPAAATGPLDTDFSTYEEPGRAAPPAGPDDWTVPEQAAQPASAPSAQIPEKTEEKPPEPPNRGPATLQALLQDPRSAEEIRTDMAAGRGHEDAVAAHGADEAQTTRNGDIIPPGAPVDLKVNNPAIENEVRETLAGAYMDASPGESIIDTAIDSVAELIKQGETHSPEGAPWAEVLAELQRRKQTAPDATVNSQGDLVPRAHGTLESPVDLIATPDVYAGAEQTGSPTEAQAEAGNYRKRHVKWNGLNIAIETEAGGARTGVGPTGEPWSVTLTSPYGYVKRTTGADNENIDVYLGPEPQSPHVYIVDQIDPETGAFDEHKALIGYPDEASARSAYVAGFSDDSGNARLGSISGLTVDAFKDWLKTSPRNPLAYSDPVAAAKGIAKEMGINATEAEIVEAVGEHRVSGTDLTDALVRAVERSYYANEKDGVASATEQGLSDAWTALHDPAAADEGSAAAPAPSEQPAEAPVPAEEGIPAHSVEPGEAQPAAHEPVEPAPVTRDEAPAAPKIAPIGLTTKDLKSLATNVVKMTDDGRARTREQIAEFMQHMATEGKKIAEHCIETGGKFSVRS